MIPQPTYGMRQNGNGRRILPREDEPQEQPVEQAQPAPQQPPVSAPPVMQAVPQNISQFPARGLFATLPLYAKWILWTVAVLSLTALLAYVLASVDSWDDAQPTAGRTRQPVRRSARSVRDDDDDDDDEGDDDDERPAARRSSKGRAGSRSSSSASQTPAIHVHVPSAATHSTPPAPSGASGD